MPVIQVWLANINISTNWKAINPDFLNISDLFAYNMLRIHFDDDETKSILVATKFKTKESKKTKYEIWGYTNQVAFRSQGLIRMHARRNHVWRSNDTSPY